MRILQCVLEGRGAMLALGVSGLLTSFGALAQPPVPPQATVNCGYVATDGQCYVDGDFTLSTSSPGANHFRVCRSNDRPGTQWGGCESVVTFSTGASHTIVGADRPNDGYRRAYYYSACDASNVCTPWGSNDETYVKTDRSAPTASGPSTADCNSQTAGATGCWVSGDFTLQVTPASDTGSGVDADGYRICRSNDSDGGFAGCVHTISSNGTVSTQISGSDLPSDEKRRAFWVRSKDNLGRLGPWNAPLYVRVDRHNPTVSATPPPAQPQPSISVTVNATDEAGSALANSGVEEIRYSWTGALNAGCTNGSPVSNGGNLQAPTGTSTLYLCARDYTGRTDVWSDGPYVVTGGGDDYSFQLSSEAPYNFGCGNFCGLCDDGRGYAYDPTVIERGGETEIFVQGATAMCEMGLSEAHDTIVEGKWVPTKGGFVTLRLDEVTPHTGSACTLREQNPAASPDVLLNGSRNNPQQDRMVFYSRGNADAFRGKVALAYEENGGWILEDDFLLYPLCFDPTPGNSDPCTRFGVARVAALNMVDYYYLYLEIFLKSSEISLPDDVDPWGLRVGTLLMRIEKQSTEPYVRLEASAPDQPSKAQLFNPANGGSWVNLDFHEGTPRGYVLELCDGDITPDNFTNWRITGAETLGDVTKTHANDYLMTYRPVNSPDDRRLVHYRLSSDPTFQSGVETGVIDLTSLNIDSASITSLHRQANGQYVLFYSDIPLDANDKVNFSNAAVKSVYLNVVYE